MPVQLSKGITYAANENITNTKLHTLVDNGSLLPGAISEQPVQSASLTTSDSLLFLDASIPALTQCQLQKLWAEPFRIGQTNKVTADFAFVSAPAANFTTATVASLVGSAPSIAKAWVNFNAAISGSASISQTTSTQSAVGTLVTATFAAAHNLTTGDSITITSYASAPLIGTWVVTVTSSTQITFNTATAPTIVAAFTVFKIPVRSSYNVTSIAFDGVETNNGRRYTINWSPTAFADANYCLVGMCGQFDDPSSTGANYVTGIALNNTTPFTPVTLSATQCAVICQNSTGSNVFNPYMHFVAFR